MVHSSEKRFWFRGVLRFVFAFVCVCLVGYIVGPTLFWRLTEKSTAQASSSCPSCVCDCSSDTDFLLLPVPGLVNSAFSDCGENEQDVNEELKKDIVALLSEEIRLQNVVSNDTLERTLAQTTDTKRASSHYYKEAEKCNAGVETCEEARQRAEAELREELKLTALWEKRARELEWNGSKTVFTGF